MATGEGPAAARVQRLALGLGNTVAAPMRWWFVGSLIGAIAGGLIGGFNEDPVLGAVVCFLGVGAGEVAAALLLVDMPRRVAFLTSIDHQLREREQWRKDTGTALPRGRARMLSWLERNPGAPGTAAVLLALGRLEEADRLIAAKVPASPTEAFDLEVERQTSAVFAGSPADLTEAERLRLEIPDAQDRRDRAQCVINLQALIALDGGQDPIAAFASGFARWGDSSWFRRPPRYLLRIAMLPLVGLPLLVFVIGMVQTSI